MAYISISWHDIKLLSYINDVCQIRDNKQAWYEGAL